MISKIKYGDLIMINFNPNLGAEIAKIRPGIVISNDYINQYSPYLIVIPLTGNINKILSFHLLINKSKTNGLDKNSKALTEQIKSIDKVRYIRKIGKLEDIYLIDLENKVSFVLNQSPSL